MYYVISQIPQTDGSSVDQKWNKCFPTLEAAREAIDELCQIGPLLANIFQLQILAKEVQRFAANPIGIPAFLKSCVIKFSTQIEYLFKLGNNAPRRMANFEFVHLTRMTSILFN